MEFDRVELREKDGKGKIRINDTDIKSTTDYSLKRGADMIDVTLTISVPVQNFKTIEDSDKPREALIADAITPSAIDFNEDKKYTGKEEF